jgi:hypothetical protein
VLEVGNQDLFLRETTQSLHIWLIQLPDALPHLCQAWCDAPKPCASGSAHPRLSLYYCTTSDSLDAGQGTML